MQLFVLLDISSFAQQIYSSSGVIESPYKDKCKFTAKLNEKTNTLSFETIAQITRAVPGTYITERLAERKGKDYTNTYTKTDNNILMILKIGFFKINILID